MLFHLFKNRVRAPKLSKTWFKLYIKRLFQLIPLVRVLIRVIVWRLKGAKIKSPVFIGKACLNGKASRLSIGKYSSIDSNVDFSLHSDVSIGNNVVINSGVRVLTGSHDVNDPNWSLISSPITVEDYAWIAKDAIILPGVTISKGTVVGAGAVVSKSTRPYTIVIGNPAKTVNSRNQALHYIPILSCAPIEAWLGGSSKQCS